MKVLVTGGAGFVGSHIVEQLLDLGASVRVLDLREPLDGRVVAFQGDLCDARLARAAVSGVDLVCHQAARVGLGVDFGDLRSYVASNDVATSVLLDALWRSSFTGRMVLASSMVVYGEGNSRCPVHGVVRPGPRLAADLDDGHFEPRCPRLGCEHFTQAEVVDEDARVDPRNVYAATKLHQEQLCMLYGREAAVPVVALRYHNVYGPRMPLNTPYAGVAAIFRSELAAGRPPVVFEDGGQTRDFVHVRDVARANVIGLTCNGVVPGAYNIASGEPHTVAELAAALAADLDAALEPRISGRWRAGDVRHIVASPARAAKDLGFRAEIPFAAGMAEFATCLPRT